MWSYYIVYQGRKRGIFSDWEICHQSVNGYSGAIHRKVNSWAEVCDEILLNMSHEVPPYHVKIGSVDRTFYTYEKFYDYVTNRKYR